MRNALVAKWRQRPCEYLTAKSATVVFKKKFHNLAVQVHAYLTTFGYINFGTMTRTTNGRARARSMSSRAERAMIGNFPSSSSVPAPRD